MMGGTLRGGTCMITRSEIEQFIKSHGAEGTVDLVWDVETTMLPKLCDDSRDGEDCRLGFAEHLIHKFFASPVANATPDGVFATFCRRFHANKQDIAVAEAHTQEDLGAANVDEADIATTMVWLWFIDATKQYGIYDV